MTCNNLLYNEKTDKNTSMQPTGLSKLTSNIPARLLPGNDMSGYLSRGKKQKLNIILKTKLHSRNWSREA